MISNRIKLLRQANQLSLQQLADNLSRDFQQITRAALSNYETGKTVPSPSMLEALSKELGVTTGYFEQPDWDSFSLRLFSSLEFASLRIQELYSYIQLELERHLNLDKLLGIEPSGLLPACRQAEAGDSEAVEVLAETIRAGWGLGNHPVSSVCHLLESQGIYLFSLPLRFGIKILSGYEMSSRCPFIFYTPNAFIDEFRYDLLKEAGHFFVQASEADREACLQHFARVILAPRESIYQDFGRNRQNISFDELSIAKEKYGISRKHLLYRLNEIHVIDEAFYAEYHYQFLRQHGFFWRNSLSSNLTYFNEKPLLYSMKYNRARSEGLITEENKSYL